MYPSCEPVLQRAVYHKLVDKTNSWSIGGTAVQRYDVLVPEPSTNSTNTISSLMGKQNPVSWFSSSTLHFPTTFQLPANLTIIIFDSFIVSFLTSIRQQVNFS